MTNKEGILKKIEVINQDIKVVDSNLFEVNKKIEILTNELQQLKYQKLILIGKKQAREEDLKESI